jgi:hypothetical protein
MRADVPACDAYGACGACRPEMHMPASGRQGCMYEGVPAKCEALMHVTLTGHLGMRARVPAYDETLPMMHASGNASSTFCQRQHIQCRRCDRATVVYGLHTCNACYPKIVQHALHGRCMRCMPTRNAWEDASWMHAWGCHGTNDGTAPSDLEFNHGGVADNCDRLARNECADHRTFATT